MKPEASSLRTPASFLLAAGGMVLCFLLPLRVLHAGDPPVLKCEPSFLRGVSGEPLQVTLTVESRSADPVTLHIPEIPFLTLRAVEKIPLRLSGAKTVVQKRIVIWQGLEAGTVTLENLCAEIAGKRRLFPPLKITVDPVPPEKGK